MVLKINKKLTLLCICLIATAALAAFALSYKNTVPSNLIVGGKYTADPRFAFINFPVFAANTSVQAAYERFRRPSKEIPLENPFCFDGFHNADGILPKFNTPEAVVLAYYGILRDASNMLGFSGGCGSIGFGLEPYPYAYCLFTQEAQSRLTLKQFIDSFTGVGYVALLKLIPAYTPPSTPPNIKYYVSEIEIVAGASETNSQEHQYGSFFSYFYCLIEVKQETSDSWKIHEINCFPEDFLCAPEHGWFYLSEAIVEIVYGDNLKLISQIDKTEQNGSMVYVYASNESNKYRFDFLRLTNGYDILLHENLLLNNTWHETSLLPVDWEYLKLTPNSVYNQ